MIKKITILVFFVFLAGITGNLLAQQDPMFTKYMFNSQVFNPGYAGSKDYLSVNILYREQWWGFNQSSNTGGDYKYSPTTQTLTLQSPVNDRVSLGATLVNDRLGATSSTSAYGVYAYHFPFATGNLSIGLQGGMINWRADWSRLNFKDPQFDDPVFAEDNPSRMMPNIGVGLYYFSKKFYAGFGIPHLIENDLRDLRPEDEDKVANTDKLYRHYYFMTGAAFELAGPNLVFKPSILIKNVGLLSDFSPNQQTLNHIGAPTEFDIDVSLFIYETFWIGASFRSAFEIEPFGGNSSTDSADLWFSVYLQNGTRLGFAYDFTLTELRHSTPGSFELMLGYDLDYKVRKVETPRYF